mmetsp:Transcript_214/g.423  ORF Transcript_214/g.423 Transcript_214/m.423 type:complete len:200 (-) Transcript_214:728-1327(-)
MYPGHLHEDSLSEGLEPLRQPRGKVVDDSLHAGAANDEQLHSRFTPCCVQVLWRFHSVPIFQRCPETGLTKVCRTNHKPARHVMYRTLHWNVSRRTLQSPRTPFPLQEDHNLHHYAVVPFQPQLCDLHHLRIKGKTSWCFNSRFNARSFHGSLMKISLIKILAVAEVPKISKQLLHREGLAGTVCQRFAATAARADGAQ